jgi:hypothetical protein
LVVYLGSLASLYQANWRAPYFYVKQLKAMHTYAMQILLHFQSTESEEFGRTENFLAALRDLAQQHGITFDNFQSLRLLSDNYRIRNCDRCGDLTVNREDVSDNIENMLPDFWFYVRRGVVDDQHSVCEICQTASAVI